jgi:hypothetical protein
MKRNIVLPEEKISKHTLSFARFTANGTANIIGKDKGVVMATNFAVVPMVMALDFAACPGCTQRGYKRCQYASFCPVLAAKLTR